VFSFAYLLRRRRIGLGKPDERARERKDRRRRQRTHTIARLHTINTRFTNRENTVEIDDVIKFASTCCRRALDCAKTNGTALQGGTYHAPCTLCNTVLLYLPLRDTHPVPTSCCSSFLVCSIDAILIHRITASSEL
jgi:hypothetical protein